MKKIIIFCLIIGVIVFGYSNKDEIQTLLNQEKALELSGTIIRKEDAVYDLHEDKALCFDGDSLIIEDFTGEDKSLLLDINEIMMETSEDNLFVANKEDGEVYLIDYDMEVEERIPLNKELFNIKESNGNLIYHIKEEEGETIGIIDSEGKQVTKHDYDEVVLNYAININNDKLAVGLLKESDSGLISNIKIYDSHAEALTLDLKDEVVVKMEFINKNDLIVLTDKKVYYINKNEMAWTKNLSLIKDMKLHEGDIYLLYSNKLEVVNKRGESIRTIDLEVNYRNIEFMDISKLEQDIVLYNEEGFGIFNGSGHKDLEWQGAIRDLKVFEDEIFILDDEKYGKYKVIYREVEETYDHGEDKTIGSKIKKIFDELLQRFKGEA